MAEVVEEGDGRWLATEVASAEELERRFHDAFEEGGHKLLVLVDGDEIVGSLGLHPTRTEGVLALGMWVPAPWRRRGGGRRLIEAAIAARPADVHKIELELFPGNEAAERLYESMGFEREGVRRSHLRRRDGRLASTVLMSRLFPDP
jgi:RimJ/RimL family protein N-acetyltransferase